MIQRTFTLHKNNSEESRKNSISLLQDTLSYIHFNVCKLYSCGTSLFLTIVVAGDPLPHIRLHL